MLKITRNITIIAAAVLAALAFNSCSDNDAGTSDGGSDGATTVRTIAVFTSHADSAVQSRMADWLSEQVATANQSAQTKVAFQIKWTCVDEPDWQLDAERAVFDSLTDVIIAPDHATAAQECLQMFAGIYQKAKVTPKPIIFPQTTSVEVQRKAAAYPYTWFMAENDMTQAEMLVYVCSKNELDTISVLATDDVYGQSFSDKLPFIIDEWDMECNACTPISTNTTTQELVSQMQTLYPDHKMGAHEALIFSSNKMSHFATIDSLCAAWNLNADGKPHIFFTDVSCDDREWQFKDAAGVMLAPSDRYGFAEAFADRFHQTKAGGLPLYGEAHDYDALLLAYLASRMAFVKGTTANEAVQSITKLVTDEICNWDASGIASAIRFMDAGRTVTLNGASGTFLFLDQKQNNTTFYQWRCKNQTPEIVDQFTSLDVSVRTDPDKPIDDWTPDDPDEEASQHVREHPRDTIPIDQRWAVVVATSKSWNYYRHDADALAMYQMLKRHGYDDRHILLVVNDELADNTRNSYPGTVINEAGGENLYDGAEIDFRTHDITPTELFNYCLTSTDFAPDADDNVFVYWVGHGSSNGNLLWLDQKENAVTPAAFDAWVNQMNAAGRYRKMLIAIETCYSGATAEALTADGALCITAAGAHEVSVVHGEEEDNVLGVYLADEFSYRFTKYADIYESLSLGEFYKQIYTNIPTSHVTLSDSRLFGCLVHRTLEDFIPFNN